MTLQVRAGQEPTAPDSLRCGPALAAAVVVIVLGPYLTVWLPFRRGLEAQALLVVIAIFLPIACSWMRNRSFRPPPDGAATLRAGIVIYGAVAAGGAIVGLVARNEIQLVAGQLLAMALLPAGFVASLAVDHARRHHIILRTLVASTVFACGIHFVYWGWRAATGRPLFRLYLPNAISAAGLIMISLLLTAAAVMTLKGRSRIWAVVAIALMAVYVVGSGTRSLWLATLIAGSVFLFLELMFGVDPRTRWRIVLVTVGGALGILVLFGLALWGPRVEVLPEVGIDSPFWRTPPGCRIVDSANGEPELLLSRQAGDGSKRLQLSNLRPTSSGGLYRASAEIRGSGHGQASVDFVFSAPDGKNLRRLRLELLGAQRWTRVARVETRVPDNASAVSVAISTNPADGADWRIRRLRLERYREWLPRPVQRQLLYTADRLIGPALAITTGTGRPLPSLDYRLRETSRVIEVFRKAPIGSRLFGRGLGARLPFSGPGYDATGRLVEVTDPNYLHNFYAFLMYKLGIVGSFLVATSISIWLWCAVRQLCNSRNQGSIHLLSAVIACWCGYLAWAIVSPELIDFRVSPVLGMTLGLLSFGSRDENAAPVPVRD